MNDSPDGSVSELSSHSHANDSKPHLYHTERSCSRSDLITAAWVEGRDKWPHQAHDLLKAVMLRDNFFSYSKLTTTSNNNLESVFRELQKVVDRNGWIAAKHDDMLQGKIRNKISQIRAQMIESGEIIKHGKVFIKNPKYGLGIDQGLQAVQAALDLLDPAVTRDALFIFLDKMGDVEGVVLAMAEWIERRQH